MTIEVHYIILEIVFIHKEQQILARKALFSYFYLIDKINMSEINYESMTLNEAKRYFLDNRHNQEAFYAYMDKLNASGRAIVIDPTDPESESRANDQIRLKLELLQRCKTAIGFDGITDCSEADFPAPKTWLLQRYGQTFYFSDKELKQYLEGLSNDFAS